MVWPLKALTDSLPFEGKETDEWRSTDRQKYFLLLAKGHNVGVPATEETAEVDKLDKTKAEDDLEENFHILARGGEEDAQGSCGD